MSNDNILIIGGGIAGLVLAQGLKHRGIPFQVFERDDSIASKGYRFRCEGPGLEALEETVSPEVWNLIEKTHPKDSPPILTFMDAHTGEKNFEMNTVSDKAPRAQRCYPIDRPWFRELLYTGIEDSVYFGKDFESYTVDESDNEKSVQLTFTDGSSARGMLLVAADGVRSRVRQQAMPHLKQVDLDRMVLWGRTPRDDTLIANTPKDSFTTHCGVAIDKRNPIRSALWSLIEFPKDLPVISGGKLSEQSDYIFWVLSTEAKKELLARETSPEDKLAWIDAVASEWHPAFYEMFKKADETALALLPIYSSCPDLERWETPNITFLGDAIHAMAPTGGVGGRTAIIDARDLCMAIAKDREYQDPDLKERLQRYEQNMRIRSTQAVEQSFQGGKMLWQGKDWWEYEKTI